MLSLPASAEQAPERAAGPVAVRGSIRSARLSTGRVLTGIALVALCAILFCLAVLYVSTPSSGPDIWKPDAVIRRGVEGVSS